MSLVDERREASAQFFPQQSSVVRAGQRSSRPGMGKQETTMAIGHATAKYGNYGQERASMATMARQQARMRMSMLVKCVWETPLGKGLTTRVN